VPEKFELEKLIRRVDIALNTAYKFNDDMVLWIDELGGKAESVLRYNE